MKKIIENIRVERENLIAKYREVCDQYSKTTQSIEEHWMKNPKDEEEYDELAMRSEDQAEKIRNYRYAINDLGNALNHLTQEYIDPFFG